MSSIRCQGIAATDRLVMPTCRWSKGARDHEEREGGKAERERERMLLVRVLGGSCH
jgi:hypothetical protein